MADLTAAAYSDDDGKKEQVVNQSALTSVSESASPAAAFPVSLPSFRTSLAQGIDTLFRSFNHTNLTQ
jgi:hypothetical protein